MHRRTLLTLSAMAALPFGSAVRAGELRVGADPALARRMQARLGVPVRAVGARRVAALNAGHLEFAVLTPAELREARAVMGRRLVVLDGLPAQGTPVTRRVLPPSLRSALERAAV